MLVARRGSSRQSLLLELMQKEICLKVKMHFYGRRCVRGEGEDEGQTEKCPSRVNNHSQWGFSISTLSFFLTLKISDDHLLEVQNCHLWTDKPIHQRPNWVN